MDETTTDALVDSAHELVTVEQASARYAGLVTLWSHRDATMHQWPPLIITASAAILALVLGQKNSGQLRDLVSMNNWGSTSHYDVPMGIGLPMFVAGIILMPFVYGMLRAITIMDNFAREMIRIEMEFLGTKAGRTFAQLNHPGGWSSRKLIVRMMAAMSLMLTVIGSLVMLGILKGTVLASLIIAFAFLYLISDRVTWLNRKRWH